MNFSVELKKYIGAIIHHSKKMYLESVVCDMDDLTQAGMLGMMDGLKAFNEEKAKKYKIKKSTFVIRCIRTSIMEEANKFYGPLKIPHTKRLRLNSFKKLHNSGTSSSDIKTTMKMGDDEYIEMIRLAELGGKNTVSIPINLEDDNFEPIADDIFQGFGLDKNEVELLKLRVLDNLSYNKIAQQYNVGKETMRKRIHRILEKIKKGIQNGQTDQ